MAKIIGFMKVKKAQKLWDIKNAVIHMLTFRRLLKRLLICKANILSIGKIAKYYEDTLDEEFVNSEIFKTIVTKCVVDTVERYGNTIDFRDSEDWVEWKTLRKFTKYCHDGECWDGDFNMRL